MGKSTEHNEFFSQFEGYEHPPSSDLWNRIVEGAIPSKGEFSSSLGNMSIDPDEEVWNRIEVALHPEKKRRVLAWWWLTGAIVLFFSVSVWQINQWNVQAPSVAQEVVSSVEVEATSIDRIAETSDDKIQLTNLLSFDPNTQALVSLASLKSIENAGQKKEAAYLKKQERPIIQQTSGDVTPVLDSRPISALTHIAARLPDPIDVVEAEDFNNMYYLEEPTFDKEAKTFHLQRIGADYAPAFALGQQHQPLPVATSSNYSSVSVIPNTPVLGGSSFSEVDQTPFAVGADAHFALGRRTGLFGGLQYTILRSVRQRSLATGTIDRTEQISRNYIGIPIGFKYQFVKRKKWQLSAKTSLLTELGLRTSKQVTDYTSNYSDTHKADPEWILKPQLSGAIGCEVNYQIFRKFGLYGEVGASSLLLQSHPNTWTEQLIWPRIKVGLNYNF